MLLNVQTNSLDDIEEKSEKTWNLKSPRTVMNCSCSVLFSTSSLHVIGNFSQTEQQALNCVPTCPMSRNQNEHTYVIPQIVGM